MSFKECPEIICTPNYNQDARDWCSKIKSNGIQSQYQQILWDYRDNITVFTNPQNDDKRKLWQQCMLLQPPASFPIYYNRLSPL
jgi:hypothetical protein